MNRTEVLTTIDRLMRETMLGMSRLDPQHLLVARALVCHVERPGRMWRVCEVAREAASKSDAIARKRRALLQGAPLSAESSESCFKVAEDSWVCHVALEVAAKQGRAVAVETLDPYGYGDSGYILDVNVLRGIPAVIVSGIQFWVVDLENVQATLPTK